MNTNIEGRRKQFESEKTPDIASVSRTQSQCVVLLFTSLSLPLFASEINVALIRIIVSSLSPEFDWDPL